MTPETTLFIKRIRHLSQALMISGALNIGVLSLFLYWVLKEHPPTPYCELKPATFEQEQLPLADQRGCPEVLSQLAQLSFAQLVDRLSQSQLVENGYAERDLALACLIAFHQFDIEKALPQSLKPQQKRLLVWKPQGKDSPTMLVVYPNLTQHQFDALITFAKTERYPVTAEGLFLQLKGEKREERKELVEAFSLTSEFWAVELLLNRSGMQVDRESILNLLLEGEWLQLKHFVEQQRQLQDLSAARRQKFLLDYLKMGSSAAAGLLLRSDWDFSVKKLDDQQVISILKLMPPKLAESTSFAKEMLKSPRSTNVWKRAARFLYAQAGESLPSPWNHQAALARFASEKGSSLPQNNASNHAVQSHVVQAGDSLWKIARRFKVKVEELKAYNKLKSDVLKEGEILKIPPGTSS